MVQEVSHRGQRHSVATSQRNLRFTYDLACSVNALKTSETVYRQRYKKKGMWQGSFKTISRGGSIDFRIGQDRGVALKPSQIPCYDL